MENADEGVLQRKHPTPPPNKSALRHAVPQEGGRAEFSGFAQYMAGFARAMTWTPSPGQKTKQQAGVQQQLPEPAEAAGPNYMPLNLYYPNLVKVHQQPPIYTIDNFLTEEECDAFITTAGPLLQRSKTHAIAGMLPVELSAVPHAHLTPGCCVRWLRALVWVCLLLSVRPRLLRCLTRCQLRQDLSCPALAVCLPQPIHD